MKRNKDIKLRYYLRGLGTGIVITTLVLAISFNVRSCTSEKSLIDDTTKEENTTQKQTKESTDKEKTTKETTSKEETTEGTTKETTSKEETTEGTTKETTAKEETSEDITQEVQTKEKITLTVSNGMASDTVAALLEEAGAIENAKDFNKYLYQMGYERILRVGTYEIEVGESYEEIARKLIQGN